jgi:hypothetical protein
MDRSLLTLRLQKVHDSALDFCKDRYGRTGLKVNEEIDPSIQWKPSYHLKANRTLTIAIEVDGTLDPEVIKLASHEIRNFETPISVILACPLEVYQADKDEAKVRALRKNGFGILTVDASGRATLKDPCVPLAQHIATEEVQKQLSGLSPRLKVAFKDAFDTYQTNVGQGLQKGGQIVEAIVMSLADASVKAGLISKAALGKTAADAIDGLYALDHFKDSRAELGGARAFAKNYRNSVSHPSKTARQAMEKINMCRQGFVEAIATAKSLLAIIRKKRFRLNVNLA